MSILNNFPHEAAATIRSRTMGPLGGSSDSYTSVFTERDCWAQLASQREILEFEKRGMSVTNKIYFLTDPGLDERHVLTITRKSGGSIGVFEVRSKSIPDATAGLAVVWRVMAEVRTTEP